jgi:hypothetical protein
MPRVGFETTIPEFRRAKTCHTLDPSSLSHFIFSGPIPFTSILVSHLRLGLPAYHFSLCSQLKFNMHLLSSCMQYAFPGYSSDLNALTIFHQEHKL